MAGNTFSSTWTDEDRENDPLKGETIILDDVTFTCDGHLSGFELSELSRLAMLGDDSSDAAQFAILAETIHQALGDEEYARFNVHRREHDTPDRVLIDIVQYINELIHQATEALTGRPTGRPQPSTAGPQDPDGRISRVISLETGDVQVAPMVNPAAGKKDAKADPARARSGGAGQPRRKRTA